MTEAKIKATPVNGVAQFVEQELEPDEVVRLKETFSPEERKLFTGKLLASQEVPVSLVNRYTREAALIKGEDVESFGRRAGRFGAELGMKTVYKFLVMVVSMETILKKSQTIFSRIYNSGELTFDIGPGNATAYLRDFPAEEVGCARLSGWLEHLGSAAKVTSIDVRHVSCRARGEKECRWELKWE